MTEHLTLISHNLCPYVQRAAIALLEKDVAFERITIDLSNKPDWFLAISPTGKVPLLRVARDDGLTAVIFESTVICEYLEETQGEPKLYPSDPLERAGHRAWMEFGSAILNDVWHLETTQDAAVFEARLAAIAARFSRIEAVLGDGPFFSGPRFSLVDAVFAPIFRYFDLFDALADLRIWQDLPKVRAWRAHLAARPSVIAAAAPDYPELLRLFLARHNSYLLTLAG
jgi:glutathione S-transferase